MSRKKKTDPELFLPLSPAAFHLLVSLAREHKHGWAVRKEIESLTDGRIRMGTGTLYGLIKRLLQQELIAESEHRPPEIWDDERRRYYRLTELGRSVMLAEASRMERALAVAEEVRNRLGAAPEPEPA